MSAITLTCALTGVVFGLFLHKKQTVPRILAATIVNQFGLSLFITTLWISILYGSPYVPLLATRVVQSGILSILEAVVMFALSKTFALQAKGLHIRGGVSHDR